MELQDSKAQNSVSAARPNETTVEIRDKSYYTEIAFHTVSLTL
jgi:hypothetical protein